MTNTDGLQLNLFRNTVGFFKPPFGLAIERLIATGPSQMDRDVVAMKQFMGTTVFVKFCIIAYSLALYAQCTFQKRKLLYNLVSIRV